MRYCIVADTDCLRIPEAKPARRAGLLWEHTCCEIFIAREASTAYYELNFSPSGEWAAYAFSCYREGSALSDDGLSPGIAVRRSRERLELDALVRLDRLSSALVSSPLALGLSAVVEETSGRLSYWALRHPPGKPDFHHPEAFALELDEARH